MDLEEITLLLKDEVLPKIRSRVTKSVYRLKEDPAEFEITRYTPLIYAGISNLREEYSPTDAAGPSTSFSPELEFVIARAKADIASHLATPDEPVQRFDYSRLAESIIELDNLREFFRSLDIKFRVGEKTYDLFNEESGFFGMSIDFMSVLRASIENPVEYELLGLPDEPKLRKKLEEHKVKVRADDTNGAIISALANRYYQKLNLLDTFQTTSVNSEWHKNIMDATSEVFNFLNQGGEFPLASAKLLLESDPKHPAYQSRTEFARRIINEYCAEKSYFLLLFDAKKLNNLNRKNMEETSIYLRELFKQGTPDDLNLRFSMDIALSELLRPIDRLLYRYNSMIYEEVTAFLNEKGFTENDFRGFLGGDETIIGLPINYWKVNSVDDALENIASLVSRIEARLDSDEFTMYGQRVGIRVGISNCKHHYYGHHIGDGFFVEDYSYALKNADTAANLSKKEGDTHPVFVGELGSNPREGNIRISQATPFRHNDYANTEASSEVARYNLIKYNLERGEIEEASIYFRNNIHAPFSAHAGNIVARVVLAGTGNFNTRNDGGAYLGAKDANNIFGFQATNEWIYDIRRFTNERLGCEIEGRSGRLTYLV